MFLCVSGDADVAQQELPIKARMYDGVYGYTRLFRCEFLLTAS